MYTSLPRRIVQALGEGTYSAGHKYSIDGLLSWMIFKTVKIERRFLFLFPWTEITTEDVGILYLDKGLPYFESEDENVCKIVDAANIKDMNGNELKVILSW